MLQKKDLARVVKIRSDRRGRLGVGISVLHGILRARCTPLFARVVKLVDTGDLKSPGHCGRAGSSPAPGTKRLPLRCANGASLLTLLVFPEIRNGVSK